jgi:UDP-glucose 4-epimerase
MNSPQAAGRVYNIGSTEEFSIENLADKIITMTGSRGEKRFLSYEEAYGKPFDDMMRRVPSLERIKETIGWVPETSLDQTLQVIIEATKAKSPHA